MIIVIAVAVLVLVVISAFFITNFGNSTQSINWQSARSDGCGILRVNYGCDPKYVNQVSVSVGGKDGICSLGRVCKQLGSTDGRACAKSCGCYISSDSANPGLPSGCVVESSSSVVDGQLPPAPPCIGPGC